MPLTELRLDVAGALLTKRVPRFALPSPTIFDDSDIEDYLRPAILEGVWLLCISKKAFLDYMDYMAYKPYNSRKP